MACAAHPGRVQRLRPGPSTGRARQSLGLRPHRLHLCDGKRANPPSQHTGSSDPGSRAATGQAADKTCRGRPAQGACQARCGGQVCPARCGGQAARPGGWCVQLAHTARAPVPPPGKPAGTDSQGPLSVQTDTHSPAERPQPSPATRERAPCSHTCAGVEPGVHVSQEAAGLWGSGWRRPQNG